MVLSTFIQVTFHKTAIAVLTVIYLRASIKEYVLSRYDISVSVISSIPSTVKIIYCAKYYSDKW